MKKNENNFFKRYKELDDKLLLIREEEEKILEELDFLWWELTLEERKIIEKESIIKRE